MSIKVNQRITTSWGSGWGRPALQPTSITCPIPNELLLIYSTDDRSSCGVYGFFPSITLLEFTNPFWPSFPSLNKFLHCNSQFKKKNFPKTFADVSAAGSTAGALDRDRQGSLIYLLCTMRLWTSHETPRAYVLYFSLGV